MKRDGLTRHYDRLTPEERFHLVLDAQGRDDEEEVRRLMNTCPTKTYRMMDTHYLVWLEGSRVAALRFSIFWLAAHQELKSRDLGKVAFRLAGVAFDQGFQLGRQAAERVLDDDDPIWQAYRKSDDDYEKLWEEMDQLHRQAVRVLKGVHQGFIRFCQARRVEPATLLRVWEPETLREIEAARDLLNSEVPADEQAANCVYQRLCQAWPTPEEVGATP